MKTLPIKYIKSLDLKYIVHRIVKQSNWDVTPAEEAVRKYKNFLLLHLLYQDFKVVPTRAIDLVWHEHILHTQKYMADCNQIFGAYFHHTPTERPEEEGVDHSDFIETARLYEKQFREPYGHTFDISIWL